MIVIDRWPSGKLRISDCLIYKNLRVKMLINNPMLTAVVEGADVGNKLSSFLLVTKMDGVAIDSVKGLFHLLYSEPYKPLGRLA